VDSTRKPQARKEEQNPVLEAALGYGALGLSTIPVHGIVDGECTCGKPDCPSKGKHPALRSWKPYQENRATEAQIRKWFAGRPFLNVGIVTGKVSGIVVLDVDSEEGHRALREAGYEIPATVHAHTGGGGDHCSFRYPEGGLGNSAGSIVVDVDVRGDGGLIVAPPSMHRSGKRYEWVIAPGEVDLAEMPTWMAVHDQPVAEGKTTKTSGKHRLPRITLPSTDVQMSQRQQEQVVHEAAELVRTSPEGERNNTLNLVVFRLGKIPAPGSRPRACKRRAWPGGQGGGPERPGDREYVQKRLDRRCEEGRRGRNTFRPRGHRHR